MDALQAANCHGAGKQSPSEKANDTSPPEYDTARTTSTAKMPAAAADSSDESDTSVQDYDPNLCSKEYELNRLLRGLNSITGYSEEGSI
jgi:hypothetical protein